MSLPGNRTLVVVAVVLIAAWLVLRSRGSIDSLPWNQGQAGSIFQPGLHMGGGQ